MLINCSLLYGSFQENVGHRSVIMDVPFLSSETGRMSSIAAKRVIKSNSGSIRQKRSLGVRRVSPLVSLPVRQLFAKGTL